MKYKWIVLMTALLILFLNMNLERIQKQKEFESIIPKRQEQETEIRVLIKNEGFREITHTEVSVSAEQGLEISCGEFKTKIEGNDVQKIQADHEWFKKGAPIRIEAMQNGEITVHSLHRGYGEAVYKGIIELYTTAEGVVMINQLPVETYLEHVVPSEMPASYALEALKAQTICARSYAYRQMESMAYPEYKAHVDDSTSYQVYGNSAKSDRTTCAVKETEGEVLEYQGEIIPAYFFSTSCGKTAGIEAWKMKENESFAYLKSVSVCDLKGRDYEKDLPWYRWEAKVSKQQLRDLLEIYAKVELGELEKLEILKTGEGGIVLEVKAVGSKGELVVQTENKIRKALGDSSYQIKRNDGSFVAGSDLLPSAFFTLENDRDNYVIRGGGYGHGIGMSQNGANEMAKAGLSYQEILAFFYNGTEILYGDYKK